MPTDSARDFLRSRRSTRRFKPDPIPDAMLERILTTATYAPSAHNRQPWRFVLIKNADVRPRLAKALTDKMRLDMQIEGAAEAEIEKRVASSIRRIDEAPVIIILCRDVTDELIAEQLVLPETVRNVGELVAFVIANYRRRQPPQHHHSHQW